MIDLRQIGSGHRGNGKSTHLAWALIEHLADLTWNEDEPPRVGAVYVVPSIPHMDHDVPRTLLRPYRLRIAVATPSSLDRTRGLQDVPWFADDVHLFSGGIQPILRAAGMTRAPYVCATAACFHVASRAPQPGDLAKDWVCHDCGWPDPHEGDLL